MHRGLEEYVTRMIDLGRVWIDLALDISLKDVREDSPECWCARVDGDVGAAPGAMVLFASVTSWLARSFSESCRSRRAFTTPGFTMRGRVLCGLRFGVAMLEKLRYFAGVVWLTFRKMRCTCIGRS